MNKQELDKLCDFLEECGWFGFNYDKANQTVEVSIETPHDSEEYINLDVSSKDNLLKSAVGQYEDFNIETYVLGWLGAKYENYSKPREDIPSLLDLVEDAQHIKSEYCELCEKLGGFVK